MCTRCGESLYGSVKIGEELLCGTCYAWKCGYDAGFREGVKETLKAHKLRPAVFG
jgi:hypothetical protein